MYITKPHWILSVNLISFVFLLTKLFYPDIIYKVPTKNGIRETTFPGCIPRGETSAHPKQQSLARLTWNENEFALGLFKLRLFNTGYAVASRWRQTRVSVKLRAITSRNFDILRSAFISSTLTVSEDRTRFYCPRANEFHPATKSQSKD